jgi:hypothetical protein
MSDSESVSDLEESEAASLGDIERPVTHSSTQQQATPVQPPAEAGMQEEDTATKKARWLAEQRAAHSKSMQQRRRQSVQEKVADSSRAPLPYAALLATISPSPSPHLFSPCVIF